MRRRATLLGLAGALVGVEGARAQSSTRRIGILVFTPNDQFLSGFKQAMLDVGYEEGRNLEIVLRDGQDRADLTEKGARELVEANVEAIVVWSTGSAQAAMRATQRIPIVVSSADPLASGFVKSLARPEGNVTGISTLAFDISGKRVDLLKETLPALKTMAFYGLEGEPNVQRFLEIARQRAQPDTEVRLIEVKGPADFEPALTRARRDGVQAVAFQQIFDPRNRELGALAHKAGLPAIGGQRSFAEAGGLLALGANQQDNFRRLAKQVDRVLAGTPIASIPIEQATRLQLTINQRSARELGVTIPGTMLARAEEVIE